MLMFNDGGISIGTERAKWLLERSGSLERKSLYPRDLARFLVSRAFPKLRVKNRKAGARTRAEWIIAVYRAGTLFIVSYYLFLSNFTLKDKIW